MKKTATKSKKAPSYTSKSFPAVKPVSSQPWEQRPQSANPGSHTVQKTHMPSRNTSYETFPLGPDAAPYRIDLADVVDKSVIAQINSSGKMVLHLNGDV